MTSLLTKIVAQFSTTLTTKVAIGDTTGTLTSGLDIEGVQLPTGTYGFLIDRNNSAKEYFTATLTGSSLTDVKNVTVGTGVGTAGFVNEHRKGAEVIISDYVAIKRMNDILDGTTDLDAATPLGYDGTATISTANQLATKAYVDGVAIAGGADASTTVKGISKMSVAPASATEPIAVGDNDPRVPTAAQVGYIPTTGQKDALVGDDTSIAVGTGNKFVTQTGLQNNTEKYAADAGSTDAYAISLSPAPTSYATGMVVHFKANTANTGACTLNVNGLGAVSIKKSYNVELVDSDIAANQLVSVVYDGANFQMSSPVSDKRVAVANTYIIRATAATERSVQGTTYTKKKEIQVNFAGTIHTTFDLRTSSSAYNVIGRLYVNGSAVGTERLINTTSDTTYTETLTIAKGDLVQVYIKTDNASTSTGYVNDFKIGFHLEEASDVSVITN